MAKLHIFIDGSWLYKAGGPVLASKTENTDQGIRECHTRGGLPLGRFGCSVVFLPRAVTTDPSTGVKVLDPGRQD